MQFIYAVCCLCKSPRSIPILSIHDARRYLMTNLTKVSWTDVSFGSEDSIIVILTLCCCQCVRQLQFPESSAMNIYKFCCRKSLNNGVQPKEEYKCGKFRF